MIGVFQRTYDTKMLVIVRVHDNLVVILIEPDYISRLGPPKHIDSTNRDELNSNSCCCQELRVLRCLAARVDPVDLVRRYASEELCGRLVVQLDGSPVLSENETEIGNPERLWLAICHDARSAVGMPNGGLERPEHSTGGDSSSLHSSWYARPSWPFCMVNPDDPLIRFFMRSRTVGRCECVGERKTSIP